MRTQATTVDPGRSRIMRAVKGKDTWPELVVRHITFAVGYRYRLHRSDLPGKPDLVFARRRKAIFVHGCFWHGHDCRRGSRIPKTNVSYWVEKITRNTRRDQASQASLRKLGWRSLVVWECELADIDAVRRRICWFLGEARSGKSL